MDPISLAVTAGISLLMSVIVSVVSGKFMLPGAVTAAVQAAAPAPAASPVLNLIGSGISDLLRQLGTGAITTGAQSMVIPFLIKVLQDFQAAPQAVPQAPMGIPGHPPAPTPAAK